MERLLNLCGNFGGDINWSARLYKVSDKKDVTIIFVSPFAAHIRVKESRKLIMYDLAFIRRVEGVY